MHFCAILIALITTTLASNDPKVEFQVTYTCTDSNNPRWCAATFFWQVDNLQNDPILYQRVCTDESTITLNSQNLDIGGDGFMDSHYEFRHVTYHTCQKNPSGWQMSTESVRCTIANYDKIAKVFDDEPFLDYQIWLNEASSYQLRDPVCDFPQWFHSEDNKYAQRLWNGRQGRVFFRDVYKMNFEQHWSPFWKQQLNTTYHDTFRLFRTLNDTYDVLLTP